MKHAETFYAVQLTSKIHPKPRLAVGSVDSGGQLRPQLYRSHKEAIGFKNQLREGGFKAAKVVRVEATYTWEAK